MSKNFNLLYVFTALLLQFFVATSPAQAQSKNQSQAASLIKTHGLIQSPNFKVQSEKILKRLSIHGSCKVLDSDIVNAFVLTDGTLVVSLGLLKLTNNTDQLAHILAHEFAHLKLNHFQNLNDFLKKPPIFFPKKKLQKLRQQQEQEADEWADSTLENSGFDNSQIHHLWQQLSVTESQQKWSDHLPLSARINKTKLKVRLHNDYNWQLLIHDLSQR